MNLRDNLALLIDKCQRPAFSRLFFGNRKKSYTSPDTFRHRDAVLIFELSQNTHQPFACTKVEALILGFLAGIFAGIRYGRSRDRLPRREGGCRHGSCRVVAPARKTWPAPTVVVLTTVHTIRQSGGWAVACDVGPKPRESQTAVLALRCLGGEGLALADDGAEVVRLGLPAPCLYWKVGATRYRPAMQPATPRERLQAASSE